MYATKSQWISFYLLGLITVLLMNIWMAKRDIKGIQSQTQLEQPIYKQLPVIPFSE